MPGLSPTWLVLVWRLPTGGSTERVWIWRSLRRLGAASLTPGAAALPYTEELEEQFDWLAQEVEQRGGDAWVLPVARLSGDEESRLRDRLAAERECEYAALREDALVFLARAADHPGPDEEYARRLRTENELLGLQRRFHRIRARDHLSAPGRRATAATIDRCLAFRQGISRRLSPVTDPVADA